MTTTPGRRWNLATEPTPFAASKAPTKGVIGEIKPHNDRGIRAGITQLRGRPGIHQSTPQLITYRQFRGQPTRYEVLAADSTQLKGVILGRRANVDKWYTLGIVESSKAAEMIPLWQCPASLGILLENQIRNRYASRFGVKLEAKGNASRPGADIRHRKLELAEFFRELAAELEAEASYERY